MSDKWMIFTVLLSCNLLVFQHGPYSQKDLILPQHALLNIVSTELEYFMNYSLTPKKSMLALTPTHHLIFWELLLALR